MRRFALFIPLILTACGTPQERCIGAATRDMRVVDRLIVETEGNLKRGYGFEEKTVYRMQRVDCTASPSADDPSPARETCLDDVAVTERQAVALDLNAEAAKLASLKAKRAEQAKAAAPAIKVCRAQFPE
ncbi:MAG: hypothetical protein ACOH2M_28135 [Cypionkella sp.]